MEKLYDLVNRYVRSETGRKNVLKYCNGACGWFSDQFVDEESFKVCLENFKQEHPGVVLD